jgi:hypothetical protein
LVCSHGRDGRCEDELVVSAEKVGDFYLPKDIISKGSPRELCRIPIDNITMNGIFFAYKLCSHSHKECIEYIQFWLPVDRYTTYKGIQPK